MNPDPSPQRPKPRAGLAHVLDAAGYSLAGLRRLVRESAVRLEMLGLIAGAVLLVFAGVSPARWAIFFGLCLLVLIVETLNTALEVLTDHVSPEWSAAARDAKDLGSLAVAFSLITVAGFLGGTLTGLF